MTVGEVVQVLGLIACAYLVGSLPIGWLVCRFGFKINILDHGSGRSGTTNVYRTVGGGAALIAFVGDLLKGFVPALVARFLFSEFPLVPMLVAIIATVGHNWSIFLKFKGGRGIATGAGAAMFLVWPLGFPQPSPQSHGQVQYPHHKPPATLLPWRGEVVVWP